MKKLSIILFLFGMVSCLGGVNHGNSPAISQVANYRGFSYRYVILPPSDIQMAWKDSANNILRSADSLRALLDAKGEILRFAMNGGMYISDGTPCGLYVENGTKYKSLNGNYVGSGNFVMPFCNVKTNGVFLITRSGEAKIVRSIDYSDELSPLYATQSGPLLVYDDIINSAFTKNSPNQLVRNGVGVNDKGEVVFVISEGVTDFYSLAKFFQEQLHCPNALYLDGTVSEMYVRKERTKTWNNSVGVLVYAIE